MTIFISHSRKDTRLPEFQLLLADLGLMRMTVWVDDRLSGGQPWWDEILRQIRICDVFLLVLTSKSLKSEACRRERAYASALHRPILPVRLTDVASWQVPDFIAQSQITDYSKRTAPDAGVTSAMSLRDAIEGLAAQAAPLPDPLPSPPEVPPSYLAEVQPLLDKKELTFTEQERFIQEVRAHLDDEDEDRQSLIGALQQFRSRPDIAMRIADDIDSMLDRLVAVTANQHDPNLDDDTIESLRSENAERADRETRPTSEPSSLEAATKMSRYPAPGLDVRKLTVNLKDWYESMNLEAQWTTENSRHIVQCRSRSWARRMGAGAALTVALSVANDELMVEIGGGKWLDKFAAAGVAWFVIWPALIPAVMGSYRQATLPSRTLQQIQLMIPLCSSTSGV